MTIHHDDGISLFVKGTEDLTNSANLLPLSAASPTTASLTTIIIQPGVYDLWYAEVNGLPAVLQASAVPEPATWAMMSLVCWASASRSASHGARYRLPKRTMIEASEGRQVAAFPIAGVGVKSTEMPKKPSNK